MKIALDLDKDLFIPHLESDDSSDVIEQLSSQLYESGYVAVATLSNPVNFHDMEDVKKTIPVQIVIMLAIGEPHGQVEMLQRVVEIIQDEKLRKDILNANTSEELLALIEPSLLGILN